MNELPEERLSVTFTAPGRVSTVGEPVPAPASGEVLIAGTVSAISAGTELLLYRNQIPPEMALDATIEAYAGGVAYPLTYGYAHVGRIVAVGSDVSADWRGQRVFSFSPHKSHAVASLAGVVPIPDDIGDEDAAFLAHMETAVTLVLDGRPLLGERVAVLGQGAVGLLVTALLARMPLGALYAVDRLPERLRRAEAFGATPAEALEEGDLDLCYELSGSPELLNRAIDAVGFSGRVVLGSWYGTKPAALELGGSFHRKRVRVLCSQVSTIDPRLTGRWDRQRRLEEAWRWIRLLRPSRLVTHRVRLVDAAKAYRMLDQGSENVLQVLLEHPH